MWTLPAVCLAKKETRPPLRRAGGLTMVATGEGMAVPTPPTRGSSSHQHHLQLYVQYVSGGRNSRRYLPKKREVFFFMATESKQIDGVVDDPENGGLKSGPCLIAGFHALSCTSPSYYNPYRGVNKNTLSVDMVRLSLTFKGDRGEWLKLCNVSRNSVRSLIHARSSSVSRTEIFTFRFSPAFPFARRISPAFGSVRSCCKSCARANSETVRPLSAAAFLMAASSVSLRRTLIHLSLFCVPIFNRPPLLLGTGAAPRIDLVRQPAPSIPRTDRCFAAFPAGLRHTFVCRQGIPQGELSSPLARWKGE